MLRIGYALSCEEHGPLELVQNARKAEELGFEFAMISDHFHPWGSQQPHSPFVWNVLGGIAVATSRLELGTGVTCPIQRIHPAILAQAAATTAAMMGSRFFFGIGSGENLNEHILGDRWVPLPLRLEMMEEAVELIRLLWKGEMTTHYGEFFTVEDCKIFTLPKAPPRIAIAASGVKAAELAGRVGDALISVAPEKEVVEAFREAGGAGKSCYAQATVCWGENLQSARRTAHKAWPNGALASPLSTELRSVEHFDLACKDITEEQVAQKVVCGPDVDAHVEALRKFADAGFDSVAVHQIGPDQEGFMRFYQEKVFPQFKKVAAVR